MDGTLQCHEDTLPQQQLAQSPEVPAPDPTMLQTQDGADLPGGYNETTTDTQPNECPDPLTVPGPKSAPKRKRGNPQNLNKYLKGGASVWRCIAEFYASKTFCDLELLFDNGQTILCHQLILASVSKLICTALKQIPESNTAEPVTICMPDFDHDAVLESVDQIYRELANSTVTFALPEFDGELKRNLQLDWPSGQVEAVNGAPRVTGVPGNQVIVLPPGMILAQPLGAPGGGPSPIVMVRQNQIQPLNYAAAKLPIPTLSSKKQPSSTLPVSKLLEQARPTVKQNLPSQASVSQQEEMDLPVLKLVKSNEEQVAPLEETMEVVDEDSVGNGGEDTHSHHSDSDSDFFIEDDDLIDPYYPAVALKQEVVDGEADIKNSNDHFEEVSTAAESKENLNLSVTNEEGIDEQCQLHRYKLRDLRVRMTRLPIPKDVKLIQVKFKPESQEPKSLKRAAEEVSVPAKILRTEDIKTEITISTTFPVEKKVTVFQPLPRKVPERTRAAAPVPAKITAPYPFVPNTVSNEMKQGVAKKKRMLTSAPICPKLPDEALEHVKMTGAYKIISDIIHESQGKIEKVNSGYLPLTGVGVHGSVSTYLIRAVVGLKKLSDKIEYQGRVLAFNNPTEEQMAEQFEDTCRAYKAVFGFSDLDILALPRLYFDGPYDKKKTRPVEKLKLQISHTIMNQFRTLPKEKLEEVLASEDICVAQAKTEPKPVHKVYKCARINISFVKDLAFEDMDTVVIITANHKMVMNCQGFSRVKNQLQVTCLQALLDVWSPQRIVSDYINIKFRKYAEINFRKINAGKMLNEDFPKWVCPDCGESFNARNKYERYSVQQHRQYHRTMDFKCDCKDIPKSLKGRIRHIKVHHSGGKYVLCEVCQWVILKENKTKHEEEQHRTFICEQCGKQFKTKKRHDIHIWSAHKTYACRTCGLENIGYLQHLQHETTHRDPLMCTVCGLTFQDRARLTLHGSVHKGCKNSDECEICGFRSIPQNMAKHRETCKGLIIPEDLVCQECNKQCKSRAGYNSHYVYMHQKEKNIDCRFQCGKKFKTVRDRDLHEPKHEQNG